MCFRFICKFFKIRGRFIAASHTDPKSAAEFVPKVDFAPSLKLHQIGYSIGKSDFIHKLTKLFLFAALLPAPNE